MNIFFCGIGGSGMMPLAQLMKAAGHTVLGSDRSYDSDVAQNSVHPKFTALKKAGIEIIPQDGTGITPDIDMLVVSSAVEPSIPDVGKALELGIPIKKRAELLSEQFNQKYGIAIAGTSGKTTVTAMTGFLLSELGQKPTIINGGQMLNFDGQSAMIGEGEAFVTETDESDKSVTLFRPVIGVLNNIALDHMSMSELRAVFTDYINNCQQALVYNHDNEEVRRLVDAVQPKIKTLSFSLSEGDADIQASNIRYEGGLTVFTLRCAGESYKAKLSVPGDHNVANALAALGIVYARGLDVARAIKALAGFKGTRRRLELVGVNKKRNITVIDDFAHNPDKIAASLKTLKNQYGRLIVFFQPHGFGPTNMMKDELIEAFTNGLDISDKLIMPEIYYAGGTANKVISSQYITDALAQQGYKAQFQEQRASCKTAILDSAQEGDAIVIMGARDDSLTDFARSILDAI